MKNIIVEWAVNLFEKIMSLFPQKCR